MLFGSVRGRINLIRPLLSNKNFPGFFSASDSLFRFLIPPPSSSSVVAKKTIDSVVTTESVLNSVVKINCFSSRPNIFCPWQNKPQEKSNGSGFVISGKKIITNAHLVANNILVQVIKHGSPKKYIAKVEAIGYESDLAILVIENEEFWEDMNPLELGDIPFLKDSVVVVGYPKGGESISITKGVVSRIDSRQYFRGTTNLPVIQTDADLNPGNSGGPVFIGNKVVGVAFQHLQHYKNIG
ncbi:putative protease Do-like 13 [Cardamine amara subsp. amara]|uniref:Protease Do-like 13 n=1 Tax=Cardamine amara subsp. amara TaxID=228776 RepID=A0ABD0ZVK9_CARAN